MIGPPAKGAALHPVEDDTTEELPDSHPGVDDGTVLTTHITADEPGGEVTTAQERVVAEHDNPDDPDEVTGWHKEPADG